MDKHSTNACTWTHTRTHTHTHWCLHTHACTLYKRMFGEVLQKGTKKQFQGKNYMKALVHVIKETERCQNQTSPDNVTVSRHASHIILFVPSKNTLHSSGVLFLFSPDVSLYSCYLQIQPKILFLPALLLVAIHCWCRSYWHACVGVYVYLQFAVSHVHIC